MSKERCYDVVIVGAGASGLMCGIHAGLRGKSVLILEKGAKPGLKILISGGGRCNFTNQWADPRQQYLSQNSHFCIAAMRRYLPSDFIDLVESEGIAYHEKKLGQLFCDGSARQIVTLLMKQCEQAGVVVAMRSEVTQIQPCEDGEFVVATATESFKSHKVVVASGGLSIPKIASDLAFRTANSLGLEVVAPRAALVPLVWNTRDKNFYQDLSGISIDSSVSCGDQTFRENILFTHRGLSGPAILQISSYWQPGESVFIDLLPDLDVADWLEQMRSENPQQRLATLLKSRFPNRFIRKISEDWFEDMKLGTYTPKMLQQIATKLQRWEFCPGGSEGYRTAEVTIGGIDTQELSSKTFEVKKVPGLYVIGEAVDVTGWLGGYNFQWAWASGYSCAQFL